MIKKIAKKSLLILLLFIITIYGVLTPMKQGYNSWAIAAGTEQDWCNECVVATEPNTNTSFWKLLLGGIDFLLAIMPRILVFICKWLVIALANLLQYAMNPRADSFLGGVNRFTGEGNVARWLWQNSLYFANIMITLFLIWIAINIILEKKEYTSYQSLVKLLVIALLINFSLVICTLLVDVSNYIASLFMSGINGQAFSCTYACVIHKVANSFNCLSNQMVFSATLSNSLAFIVALIFIGQLLGLIIFVFTRMIYLWFLVGVSPLAIVLYAIPETEGVYKKWLEMFTANLMKLPLIAAATYFILNIMLFIENKSMTQKVAESDVIEHVLASAFVTIILSQGLLMAAQAIGVEQIAKMSAAVSSVAKKGWDAIRKPAINAGVKRFTASKRIQNTLNNIKGNRVPLIGGAFANMANQAQNKIRQEQDASQKEIDNYKNNGNYGQLETNLRWNAGATGDKSRFIQNYEALADLKKQGKWKDPNNLLEKYRAQARELMDQDLYKRSDAGKKLRDSDVFFDAGPSSKAYETEARVALGPGNHSKRQISRKARELAELGINRPYQDRTAPGVDDFINNVQERINDRSKFRQTNWQGEFDRLNSAMRKNNQAFDVAGAGTNFANLVTDFQETIRPKDMKSIFDSISDPGDKEAFWKSLATMVVRAYKIKNNYSAFPTTAVPIPPPLPPGTLINNIPVSPAEIKNSTPAFRDLALNNNINNSWVADAGMGRTLKYNRWLS